VNDRAVSLRGCFKYGCLAVLALLGVAVLWTGTVVSTAWLGARAQQIERVTLEGPAAQPDASARPGGAAGGGEDAAVTVPGPGAGPEGGSAADAGRGPVGDPLAMGRPARPLGRVVLEFTVGEFIVEPGEPGDPVSIEAEFDTEGYALEDSFRTGTMDGAEGDEPWVYRVDFSESGLVRDGGLRTALFGAEFPKIRVRLPPDVPLELELRFGKGVAEIELGGLWLTDVQVDLEKGGLDLAVSRPLVAPMGRLSVDGHQGGMNARRLGNASPRELDIDLSMGGGLFDLQGAWLNDAQIRASARMGGMQLQLPRNVRVVGLDLPLDPPRSRSDEGFTPTLELSVSSFLGEVEVLD